MPVLLSYTVFIERRNFFLVFYNINMYKFRIHFLFMLCVRCAKHAYNIQNILNQAIEPKAFESNAGVLSVFPMLNSGILSFVSFHKLYLLLHFINAY